MIQERLTLARGRIEEIASAPFLSGALGDFFWSGAAYLKLLFETYDAIREEDFASCPLDVLRDRNRSLYADLLPEAYETSFANPSFSVSQFGEKQGRLLSFIFAELHSQTESVFEGRIEELLIRAELFLEIYQSVLCDLEEEKQVDDEAIRRIIYAFLCDYQHDESMLRVKQQLDPSEDFALQIVTESDLSDLRYLYRYGEYVTEEEEKMASFLGTLPEETIRKMADTFTEGYRIGFEVTGRDLSKKDTVNIRYHIGFERVVERAVRNFERLGLKPVIYRASMSIFHKGKVRIGYMGADPNRQFTYDHKDDRALFLDKHYNGLRLEALQAAYEAHKELAAVHGGPACMETFGEANFSPIAKKETAALSEEQQKLTVAYASKAGSIINTYIKGEERSFTIIAFPMPAIGPDFEAIFEETIRVNTLDYMRYRNMQQLMIDALDEAVSVRIKGCGKNRTDLTVALHPLTDPSKETVFENCVADVNIPVGEIFTSPVLAGTNGMLHVTDVFLEGLEYKDLCITFQDGMTVMYSCANFDDPEDGKKYVRDNVLFSHERLPMGEFAIGTNTTAYAMAKHFGIADRLPILIAEKTGPHFAVGDTCYSHAEDIAVYNPDGKEIVARDNACSILRKTDESKAYFNCHTDITVPYDELGELTGVRADGTLIPIIRDGRFVIEGAEELNIPLSKCL
ncbi:MAG: aminopeptidase [Lachnospiraceae bacterium]|nr:aminopeptidase [Lachnospiraceae bacterium]